MTGDAFRLKWAEADSGHGAGIFFWRERTGKSTEFRVMWLEILGIPLFCLWQNLPIGGIIV